MRDNAARIAPSRGRGRSRRQPVVVLRPRDTFPIPDPRRWPADVCEWLRVLKAGDEGPCLFHYGPCVAMYCEDALAALDVLDVAVSEWSTAGGYPAFVFDPCRIAEILERLAACGYMAHVLEPEPASRGELTGQAQRASVVNIAVARERLRRAKGAIL